MCSWRMSGRRSPCRTSAGGRGSTGGRVRTNWHEYGDPAFPFAIFAWQIAVCGDIFPTPTIVSKQLLFLASSTEPSLLLLAAFLIISIFDVPHSPPLPAARPSLPLCGTAGRPPGCTPTGWPTSGSPRRRTPSPSSTAPATGTDRAR